MKRNHLITNHITTCSHNHLSTRSRGFTIIELMINIVTMSILAFALGSVLFKWIQLWQLSSAKGEIQRDARTCISAVNKHLRQGTATSVVLDRYDANQPPYSMLSFEKDGNLFRYYQDGRNFREFTEVSNSTRTLATSLRSVQFIYPETTDTSILNVSITFEKATFNRETKALQLSVQKVRIMN